MDKSVLAEALLQSAGDAIIATDCEGIITLWNAGATRIFGHGANEAVGQSLDLIIPENQRARHWAGYREVMRTGQSRYAEGAMLAVPALRKDGTRISIEFTIVPLKDVSGTMQSPRHGRTWETRAITWGMMLERWPPWSGRLHWLLMTLSHRRG